MLCHDQFPETEDHAKFLQPVAPGDPLNEVTRITSRHMAHSSLLAGTRLVLPLTKHRRPKSGYQALRLATELLPATFAALGVQGISPFWAVLAFFTLILFGIAQQVTIFICFKS